METATSFRTGSRFVSIGRTVNVVVRECREYRKSLDDHPDTACTARPRIHGIHDIHGLCGLYIVGPSTQGANSSSPYPIASLLLDSPEAVLRIISKNFWPTS